MSRPTSPFDAISLVLEDSPAAPRSWRATSRSASDQLQAALDQLALLERVADLDARALGVVGFVELRRGEHAGAADAVTAGARAEQHEDVAGPAAAELISLSAGAIPTHIAFTRQFCS